ncbi:MAG: VanZ family protein [Marinobacter sp.]|nr:VanZ family protein [Marinobacter sp.]
MPLKQSPLALFRHRFFWRICLAISVVAILFLATTSEAYPIPSAPSDKVNHLIAFLELTLLVRLSWPRLPLGTVALSVLAFGMSIELIQAPLPYRDFSLWDLLADGVGIALGLAPWPGLRRPGPTARSAD